MRDISSIPVDELLKDLEEGRQDLKDCDTALIVGQTKYSGGSVQSRRDTNVKINSVIENELLKRGVAIPVDRSIIRPSLGDY